MHRHFHPGFWGFWQARRAGCGPEARCGAEGHGCGPGAYAEPFGHRGPPGPRPHHGHFGGDDDGGSFGVRRPLRFLAYKLDLSEEQVTGLARVLNDLKTERAQAAVDDRRTTAAFADLLDAEAFDAGKATGAAAERVKSAERLRDAVARALGAIHALLEPPQRAKLAYLIRTGALVI